MKLKSIITFSILVALSFSIMHEFAFAEFDEKHCSISEYVSELEAPNNCGDICDIHFEYHQAYVFPQKKFYVQNIDKTSELIILKESYDFSTNLDLVIPPTA
ncbi:MAG: hypothetical protein L3J19_03535 [Sulfurimonas sp.]|nr:hypothetical protein [Sulfurimonas sp.]